MPLCIQHDVAFPERLLHQVQTQGLGTAIAFDAEMGVCFLIGIATGKKPTPNGEEGRGVTFLLLNKEVAAEFAMELLAGVSMIDVTLFAMGHTPPETTSNFRELAERVEVEMQQGSEAAEAEISTDSNLRSWTGTLAEEKKGVTDEEGAGDSRGSHGGNGVGAGSATGGNTD